MDCMAERYLCCRDSNPTSSHILGIFALTNILVALILILLGRGLVTKKFNCGMLGRRGSWSYTYLWPPNLGLQMGANAMIAALIKRYLGDES